MKKSPPDPQFTILVDTREQSPYEFRAIRERAPHADHMVTVRTRIETLTTGDYAVAVELAPGTGQTLPIRVERKSKSDLFGTIGAGRERFRREMERAAVLGLRLFLVAECTLRDCVADPPPYSELPGLIVVRTLESWAIRYGLNVWWCGTREHGEQVTYRLLEFAVIHYLSGKLGRIGNKGADHDEPATDPADRADATGPAIAHNPTRQISALE